MSKKVPVTTRALIQRINRKLAHEDEKLLTARLYRGHEDSNVGRYYIIDTRRNIIEDDHVDLETFARDLKVMEGWEELADES